MRRVTALTFLNNFVAGALTLLIPLLLLERNVNLADIGVVLSVLPLVFLVARLLLAAIADQVGWSHIFILVNWPATLISTALYYFATSLPPFFAGKVIEGLRDSSYWAVNRTAIFQLSPAREVRQATSINGVIWIATAVGSAAAGVGIAFAGFSVTLLLLVVASIAVGIPAAMLWKTGKKDSKLNGRGIFTVLDARGKGRTFWLISVALTFYSLATFPLLMLLLPAFMDQQLGYNYLWIGMLFMLYNVVSSAATFLTLRASPSFGRAALLSVVAVVASVGLATGGFLFPACLCALAFVRGYGIAFFEHAVAKAAKSSRNVSADIALLHSPMRIAESASVLASGFLAQTVGYAPIFAVTGVFFVVFSFMSLHLLRKP